MKLKLILILLNLLLYSSELRIIPPQSKYDSSHSYFNNLINLILANTQEKYGKSFITFSQKIEQGRALMQLKNNKDIDIYWAGTSKKREKDLIAIKIPLLKGLLGYRMLIINKNLKSKFDNIKTIDDLKKLKACQGKYWPDSKILKNSGFKVVENTNYESMFLQVEKNRCDYFPRGVHEIKSEIQIRKEKYKNLIIYDKIIIYYPFPMYFFVSKYKPLLAKRIEDGLNKLIKNGTFLKHLKNHITTKHIFPLKNWQDKAKIFKIKNPYLSENTNYKNNKFWIVPN